MPYQYDAYDPTQAAASIGALLMRRGEMESRRSMQRGDLEAQRAMQIGNAQAQAALQSGQAWGGAMQSIGQTLAAIPQQMQQQKRAAMQDELTGLQVNEAKRGVQSRSALGAAISSTPHVDEDGVSVYDIASISKKLEEAGFGEHVGEVATSLKGINDAFRTERSAKLALVQRGAQTLIQAGADPELTMSFIDTLDKNGTFPKGQLDLYRQIITRDPSKTDAILRQFAGPAKITMGKEGDTPIDELTGKPVGPKLASTPNTDAELAADAANPNSPTHEQSAAALATLQAPTMAQRDETARHNAELERIAGLTAGREAAELAERKRHNAAVERISQESGGPLEAVIGKDGNPVLVPRSQARGMRPATTREQPTEDERKTAGFYGQMTDAIKILDQLESSLTEKELYQIQTLPQEGLIGMANRGELSENAKRYLRAFEQFTEARLRPVSGAAINDQEYARDRRTYAKQYGETPALSADRKAARDRALASLKTRASRALPKDDAPSGGPKEGDTKPIDGYPGTEQMFRNGKWIRTK